MVGDTPIVLESVTGRKKTDQASCEPTTERCWCLHCPELVPCAPLLTWKPVDTLSSWLLSFGLVWAWAQFATKVRCLENISLGFLFPGKSVFLGKKQKHAALCQVSMAPMSTLCCSCLRNKRANRHLDFFAGIVFSHPFPTPFLLFCPLIFCPLSLIVEKIGQASIAHFKN